MKRSIEDWDEYAKEARAEESKNPGHGVDTDHTDVAGKSEQRT